MHGTNRLSDNVLVKLKECAAVLRSGGIAAFPTDTVYGLGANIYIDQAVKKIFTVKQRPLNLPLPVLIYESSQLKELVADIPDSARKLMTAFWPGALTLVFHKAPSFSSAVLAGERKVAVRMPDHPISLRLIKETGCPIVGTSANLHGMPAVLTAVEVIQQLGSVVDYILDAGPCLGGVESTIMDVTVQPPLILRRGAVSDKKIADYLE